MTNGQHPPALPARRVDLGGQPTAGTSQRVIRSGTSSTVISLRRAMILHPQTCRDVLGRGFEADVRHAAPGPYPPWPARSATRVPPNPHSSSRPHKPRSTHSRTPSDTRRKHSSPHDAARNARHATPGPDRPPPRPLPDRPARRHAHHRTRIVKPPSRRSGTPSDMRRRRRPHVPRRGSRPTRQLVSEGHRGAPDEAGTASHPTGAGMRSRQPGLPASPQYQRDDPATRSAAANGPAATVAGRRRSESRPTGNGTRSSAASTGSNAVLTTRCDRSSAAAGFCGHEALPPGHIPAAPSSTAVMPLRDAACTWRRGRRQPAAEVHGAEPAVRDETDRCSDQRRVISHECGTSKGIMDRGSVRTECWGRQCRGRSSRDGSQWRTRTISRCAATVPDRAKSPTSGRRKRTTVRSHGARAWRTATSAGALESADENQARTLWERAMRVVRQRRPSMPVLPRVGVVASGAPASDGRRRAFVGACGRALPHVRQHRQGAQRPERPSDVLKDPGFSGRHGACETPAPSDTHTAACPPPRTGLRPPSALVR